MLTFVTLGQQYVCENFWLAQSTRETVERACRYFAQATGNRRIDRISPDHGQKYKGWLLKTGRSKNTANMYMRAVKSVFSWAVQSKKILPENPLVGLKQFRVTRRPIRIYERRELLRMLDCCPSQRWRLILLCAYTTGMRRGEILNVTWDNIRNGFIHVEPKRNTKQTWEWEAKDKELRQVPLVDELDQAMQSQQSLLYPFLTEAIYQRMLRLSQSGLLNERQRKCPDWNFRRSFVRIQKKAFGRQINNFHGFRKTYTTLMAEVLPQHFVMRLTGHNSSKTMTHYLAVRQSYYSMARELASNAIKKGPVACNLSQKGGDRYQAPNWAVLDLNQ